MTHRPRLALLAAALATVAAMPLAAWADDVGRDDEDEIAPTNAVPPRASSGAAAPIAKVAAEPALAREWCTGRGPVSWGFSVTPTRASREVRLRSTSSAVDILAARGGTGLPLDWTVALVDGAVVATGGTALPAGTTHASLLVVDTDRSTADVAPGRGATPVEWEVGFADAAGSDVEKVTAAFPPVMDLRDAVQRGIVLATVEGLSPTGPVELTVDNPTWQPLWLEVPAGTILSADGRDWVVGLCPPFRMMRKQKTGRTVTAFPLQPSGGTTPRRLAWSARDRTEETRAAREVSLAVQRLQDLARARTRASGEFERGQPFDFWPLVVRWSTWSALGLSDSEAVAVQVAEVLAERAAAGDQHASRLDPTACADEVQSVVEAVLAERDRLHDEPLSLELRCARACFR